MFFNKLPLKQITKWNVPKTFKLSKHAKIERVIIIQDYDDYLMLRNETDWLKCQPLHTVSFV